jgi:RNA polymerase sigma-70 factor (ECF subfamily)
LGAARGGDARAFDALLERYRPHLLRWAHGRLPASARQRDDTVDLVQDVLLQFHGRIGEFQGERAASLLSYLHTSILNAIRARIRHARVRDRHQERLPNPQALPSPLEELLGAETLERYERALETLSAVDRELVLAHVELGISNEELAELTDKPNANAARVALQRALLRLARAMGESPARERES